MTQQPGQGFDPDQYPGDHPDAKDRSTVWLWIVIAVAVIAAAVLLYLNLRSGDSDAEASASPTPSASETTTTASATTTVTTSSTGPTTPAGFSTDPVTEGGFPQLGDDIGYGTAVRVGHHDGYDRVTFEFSGSGTPSYQVQYTDSPQAQNGDPVDVKGDAYLQVTITSVGTPSGTATPTMTTPSTDGTVFAQVDGIWGGFEGYGETFIGINGGQRPFMVQVLQDPMRLVVDVANG